MKTVVPFVHRINDSEEALWIEHLNAHWPGCEVRPLRMLSEDDKNNAEVAIVANPDPVELRQLPKLKWVQSLWAGVENLTQFSADTGISVVRMEDPNLASTMAEAVLTWALFLNRDMHRYAHQQQDKVWQPFSYKPASDCTVGILGLGKLGLASARALNAHGFKTIGWSYSQKQIDFMSTFQGRDGLTTVARQSDIIVVLLPLTAQTKGLINAELFSEMKAGSCLLNFARGPIVEIEPLLDFLGKTPSQPCRTGCF